MVKGISYYGAQTHVKNIAKYVILHSSNLSSCHQRRVSLVSQGTASSQATSTLGTWCEACWSLQGASHWLPQAMVLSGMLGEGLGEAAGLHHSCGAVTPLASPCAITDCPWAPLQCSLNCSGCTEMLWEHRVFKGTWNFSIPKSHEVAAFLVLDLAPLCLAELNFCPAHAGMMLQQWRHDA